MATTSEVKAGLDDVAQEIRTERQALKNAKARVAASVAALNSLPTKYADIVATVNGYTPTGSFETEAKDELAKLTTEFQALKTKAATAQAGLDAIDFIT